jgi:hypothetical protein
LAIPYITTTPLVNLVINNTMFQIETRGLAVAKASPVEFASLIRTSLGKALHEANLHTLFVSMVPPAASNHSFFSSPPMPALRGRAQRPPGSSLLL